LSAKGKLIKEKKLKQAQKKKGESGQGKKAIISPVKKLIPEREVIPPQGKRIFLPRGREPSSGEKRKGNFSSKEEKSLLAFRVKKGGGANCRREIPSIPR